MHTVVFVHGTGVRSKDYDVSYAQIQAQLTRRLGATGVRLEPCFWGGAVGSDLFLNGISIPEVDTTRAVGGVDPDQYVIALWALLYEDPVAELDLLGLREAGERPPSQEPPGQELDDRVRDIRSSGDGIPTEVKAEFVETLVITGLAGYFDAAIGGITGAPEYQRAIESATEPLTEYRVAIARAILAQAVVLYREDLEATGAPFDAVIRDRLVDLLVAALGGREAGVLDWVKGKAGRLVSHAGTRWFRKRRGRLSVAFAPFAADIIAYQARPLRVQAEIRRQLLLTVSGVRARGESGTVTVLAHSLGGIATVDMLLNEPMPEVDRLVTVGSQSPLLYELDALTSLEIQRDPQQQVLEAPHPLPARFTVPWLNIFDPRDFLSYKAEPIFGRRHVRDVQVDNGQPFPDSHSAYWTNTATWTAVLEHLGSAT